MICHNQPQSLDTHFVFQPGMHHIAFMDCCRRVSPMGRSEKHAPRTPLAVESSQQFVSRRQRYLVAEPPLAAIGPQGRPGTATLVLPHFLVWWSPGKDPDPSETHRFYWSGMSDDVKEWLGQCMACVKRKSPVGRHHPLGNIPTGHRWDRIAMDILDVCDPTPEGFRYILVIADYFSKWTEAFPMKNKCADTVADLLVDNIILRFGMPLVIHSDQGREFENGLINPCKRRMCADTSTTGGIAGMNYYHSS